MDQDAYRPNDLSSIPGAHVKVERTNFERVGWKEDLVVKSMYVSTGGLEFSSQHPHQLLGCGGRCLRPTQGTQHPPTHRHAIKKLKIYIMVLERWLSRNTRCSRVAVFNSQ